MSRLVVGNDVVDLTRPRTRDRHTDMRFLERVFSSEERGVIGTSARPAAEVWALWSAKEAAYKIASKLRDEPPVFEHAAFRVAWDVVDAGHRRGQVRYENTTVPVLVDLTEETAHAVATSALDPSTVDAALLRVPDTTLDALLSRLTAREAGAVHSVASAAVRLAARGALARVLGHEEAEIEIVCDPGVTGRRPPRVFLGGHPAPADVSLSHDGGWMAWAVAPQ